MGKIKNDDLDDAQGRTYTRSFLAISYTSVFLLGIELLSSFFEAIYWATVSLTTVGYGDIYATSQMGKIITMISAILGIAIVALPAGIVTAGYMNELNNSMPNRNTEV